MNKTHDLNTATKGHMADADRLKDSLCDAKERATMYASAALECTNNGVREFFLAMHGEETHNQEILFSFLHARGYYPVSMASQEAIQKTRDTYQQMHQQMGLSDTPSFRQYQTADPKAHPAKAQIPEHFQPH